MRRLVSGGLLLVAIVAGTLSDRAPRRLPVSAGGYRVLAGDFHVHTFPSSAGVIAPWDVNIEAVRQGLDVIAISGHNEAYSGRVGGWFARTFGGPIVLPSEEVHTPSYHMIAVGIRRTISWRLPAAQAIEEIHRQGGVAIAAHPIREAWAAYDAGGATRQLDGAEVLQPEAWSGKDRAQELRDFFARSGASPIASSDWHGAGPVGVCRTYLFVKAVTEAGVLDAIRTHRTILVDGDRAYGDPEFVRFATDLPPAMETRDSLMALLSRICGVAGLLAAVLWK